MSITVSRVIAGLVVLVAVIMAFTTVNPMIVMLLIAALGIAIIVPW